MKMKNINRDDLRWHRRIINKGSLRWSRKNLKVMTYIETLEAMCNNYSKFCGRWHDNKFWKKTKAEIKTMLEVEAKKKVFEIVNDADSSLAQWKLYQ